VIRSARLALLLLASCGSPETAHSPTSSAPSDAPPPLSLPSPSPSPSLSPSPSPSPSPAPAQRPYVVAAIGDSLTDPRSHGGIYLEVLRQRCPKSRFESYGVGGNMANMMKRRFVRDVYGEDPPGKKTADRPAWTHVIILGGLGDVISNLTAKRTAAAIQRDIGWMVDETHRRGAKALVLTLPPWAGANQYDGVRAQMARDVNTWILGETGKSIDASFDTRPVLSCGQPERLCADAAAPDGLHWSRAGQEKLGDALARGPFADCQ
jgi:lysophospholipase L1-like esterase